jgi:hypothetical protein
MKVKKISSATISDIHLGHRRNSASEIITNLRGAVGDNTETAQLDIIYLAGDVFDDLLLLNSDEVIEIDFWIINLIRICVKHSVKLRILEGTPRHDRGQSRRFEVIHEAMGKPCDLKYITEISIEHIEDFGIDVLYVPDEATESPEKTLKIVRELMVTKGLTQVDFAIMHGCMDYQIPYLATDHKHDSAAYLELVRYLINIGHVHTFHQNGRIIGQGSFDRLTHGQEEKKGHIRHTVWQNGEWELEFVENKGAKTFITLDCASNTLEETLVEIQQLVSTLRPDSHVRLRLSREHPLLAAQDTLIRRWPMINWAKDVKETGEEEQISEALVTEEDDYVPISITPVNIVQMVMTRLNLSEYSAEVLVMAQEMLEEIVRGG